MRQGDLIAERFQLEHLAGEGAMGAVWSARDRQTGGRVALKVQRGGETERIVREAQILAEADHPGIVALVAHGRDERAGAWLAMEWIDGEDLARRLERGPLPPGASLALARRIAGALGTLHARGVIHRDIKPTNIMLPGGRLEEAKLLDLGLARVQGARPVTRAGAALGTPGYMAPEQARGASGVDARADVYSLGSVLFECITGKPLFTGEHFVAVLAKVLMQEVPRLGEVMTGVPPEVDDLVARMLAKNPAERPPDGAALERELAAVIADVPASSRDVAARPSPSGPAPSLSDSEAYVASVVLAAAGGPLPRAALEAIPQIAMSTGASIDALADGSLFGLLSRRGQAQDQAAAAARLALALQAMLPGRACVLATGRTSVAARYLVGEAIDRASELLRASPAEGVRIDDVTAGLLGARFDVSDLVLRGERDAEGAVRTVLGKAVPCVGRDREIAALEALYDECVARPDARAVLVTGSAGVGKSRLLHELVLRLRSRDAAPAVWVGRGDPMSAGSPLAILADALRRALGIRAGEPLEVRRWKVRTRVSQVVRSDAERVAWFIGELLGAPFDAGESVQIASARRDPQLMADQMRRAFEDFVCAELAARPVLLVLEDLQWGDSALASFVDSALRVAAGKPLMVVASGRDEVRERFPNLWAERAVREIRLVDLATRSAAKLVRAMLPTLAAERVGTLVDLAAGNPLFLEELVRAEAEGRGASTPGSVLAMVTSRLESLSPDLRRVLRAAAVFGRTTWRGALESLLRMPAPALEAHVSALVEHEILVRMGDSRFPGDEEYLFRHEIVREAAYRMLTDADRAIAHAQAGKWLERAGEQDGLVLAEHYDKGGDKERAIAQYLRATQQALDSSDFDAAFARAERGIALGAAWETCGELRSRQAEIVIGHGDNERARALGELALADLEPRSAAWCQAASIVILAAQRLGDLARADALGAELLGGPATPLGPYLRAAFTCTLYGRDDLAMALAEKGKAAVTPADRCRLHEYRRMWHKSSGDPAAAVAESELSVKAAEECNNLRLVCQAETNLGDTLKELGAYAEASARLTSALRVAERIGYEQMGNVALHNLGFSRAREGAIDEGLRLERAALEAFARHGEKRMVGLSKAYLAMILLDAGQLEPAEACAREATTDLAGVGPLRHCAGAVLARVLAARGYGREAALVAREPVAFVEAGGRLEEGEALARLAWAEALLAMGDREGAHAAILAARRALLERASHIGDKAYRQSFLERVPEHARTNELYARLASG
jgi:tetratricopeptide (TPR) repeat protein